MEIYFSPEYMDEQSQILNVVNEAQKAIGFLCILKVDKKMYVFGNLHNVGAKEDFTDLLKPYLEGMAKMNEDIDMFSYLTVGGEWLELNEDQQSDS